MSDTLVTALIVAAWKRYDQMVKQGHVDRLRMQDAIRDMYVGLGEQRNTAGLSVEALATYKRGKALAEALGAVRFT